MPTRPSSAIAFGEVIVDFIETDRYVGGAPLNLAWYLSQFDVPTAILSAVGTDDLAPLVRQVVREGGIADWLTERPEPTGRTDVRIVDGQPHFDVRRDVAWEHITLPANGLIRPKLVYFGTAAQGSETNRATLHALLQKGPRYRVFDANLRPGFIWKEVVLDSLERANVLKLNEEEWQSIRHWTGCLSPASLIDRYDLELLALTKGQEGAELFLPGTCYATGAPAVRVVDTVGAGDAFSGTLCAALIKGIDLQRALTVACDVGAYTVKHRGGQVVLPEKLTLRLHDQQSGSHRLRQVPSLGGKLGHEAGFDSQAFL